MSSLPIKPVALDRPFGTGTGTGSGSAGLRAKFKPRLLSTFVASNPASVSALLSGRGIGFQARLAEFVLLNRLKARSQRDESAEIMARAERIVFVTCKNWFAESDRDAVQRVQPL